MWERRPGFWAICTPWAPLHTVTLHFVGLHRSIAERRKSYSNWISWEDPEDGANPLTHKHTITTPTLCLPNTTLQHPAEIQEFQLPSSFFSSILSFFPPMKLIPDRAHAYRTHISISAWLCLSQSFVCVCPCALVCEWLYELFISGRLVGWGGYNLQLAYLCWVNKLLPYLRHYDKAIQHRLTSLCGAFQGTWNAVDTTCRKSKCISVYCIWRSLFLFIHFVSTGGKSNFIVVALCGTTVLQ